MSNNDLHVWNAPSGFWYTEKGEREERSFVQHLRSQSEHFVDNYEIWSDEQKEQWEKDHPQPIVETENEEENGTD